MSGGRSLLPTRDGRTATLAIRPLRVRQERGDRARITGRPPAACRGHCPTKSCRDDRTLARTTPPAASCRCSGAPAMGPPRPRGRCRSLVRGCGDVIGAKPLSRRARGGCRVSLTSAQALEMSRGRPPRARRYAGIRGSGSGRRSSCAATGTRAAAPSCRRCRARLIHREAARRRGSRRHRTVRCSLCRW
jgi:hypothetical protein